MLSGCVVAIEFGSTQPFKQKRALRSMITENGGTVSSIITKTVSLSS